MKEYKVGDSIYWRDDDVTKTWGRVTGLSYSYPSGQLMGYRVRPDGDGTRAVKVDLDQVIDLQEVSNKAAAAIDRWHRQDREKAQLFDELLGVLSYYARCDGQIRYVAQLTTGTYEGREPVQDLVDAYLAKRDHVYRQQG